MTSSYCGVYGCTHNSKTDPHLSYFSLPKDEERRKKWIEFMDRSDLMNIKNPRHLVCSVHFAKEMLKTKRLKPDAVPTLNLPGSKDPLCGSSSKKNLGNKVDKPLTVKMVQENNNLDSLQIEAIGRSESGSATRCQSPVDEELWVVRKQLCRGCHSDGAFWSLQIMTEGVAYGDLLQKYFNIRLCPVSKDELALSAICSLCAARLRDARAFSAQAHAAEERFTRFYKQNRVRVSALVNEDAVKEDVPKIKVEVDVELETADSNLVDFELETANSNLVDFELETADSNLDNPESSVEKLAPTVHKYKRYQVRRSPFFRLSPSDYERVGKLFKCTRCNKLCTRGRISKHVKHTHLKLPQHNCPHCDKTFVYLYQFTKHKLKEHSIDDRIKCNACNWHTYQTKSELIKHKNEVHMLGEKLTCPDCDYVSFSRLNFRKHTIRHSTVKAHQCKYCKKSFLRQIKLIAHEKIHTGNKNKVCNVCGQAFVKKASLTYHMAKRHPEVI